MYRKSRLIVGKSSDLPQEAMFKDEYDTRRLVNVIRRYHELKSAAEITIAVYEPIQSGGGYVRGKDHILCVLADIDRGLAELSSRQRIVVELLKRGYQVKEIASFLGVTPTTVKFHFQQAVSRLSEYLNNLQRKEVKR